MQKVTRISFLDQPLFRVFSNIKDPRVCGRCLYPLFDIIFIVLCAMIAGADGCKSIENFAKKRRRFLSQFINLENGMPSQFTLARVFSRINTEELERCVRFLISALIKLKLWSIINVDGKTARGSGHVSGNKKKMHLINAY